MDILLHDDGDSIGWLLINQNAGALDVGHLLIPSPDGQLWAETISWEAPPGAINLYVLEPSAWKKVATLPVAFACDLRWTGSDSLTFRTSMDFSSPPGGELHAKFKDGQLTLLDK